MRLLRPEPRAEWYPQDPDGPLPPMWFYFVRNIQWVWLAIVASEFAAIAALWFFDAPNWMGYYLGYAIWFGVGVQFRGIWQQRIEHKAKMAKMNYDHQMRMGWYDRRIERFVEAAENGYSVEWLRMRGVLNKDELQRRVGGNGREYN